RVCLRLPAYSASAKVICFIIEKLGDWCPVILPNQEVFFRVSLVDGRADVWPRHLEWTALPLW
ncbi:hypothetical protein, partial [Pseudomonas sp. EA_15y_Pfl2_R67]|uniref:hypothetical protein n=1 Tax=Pseudomonas sp. EA_15y_Pfl2_R67 TaxID=3088687 RepID=UPI0030D96A6C